MPVLEYLNGDFELIVVVSDECFEASRGLISLFDEEWGPVDGRESQEKERPSPTFVKIFNL